MNANHGTMNTNHSTYTIQNHPTNKRDEAFFATLSPVDRLVAWRVANQTLYTRQCTQAAAWKEAIEIMRDEYAERDA